MLAADPPKLHWRREPLHNEMQSNRFRLYYQDPATETPLSSAAKSRRANSYLHLQITVYKLVNKSYRGWKIDNLLIVKQVPLLSGLQLPKQNIEDSVTSSNQIKVNEMKSLTRS